jgi:hypothetical protein
VNGVAVQGPLVIRGARELVPASVSGGERLRHLGF